MMSELVLKNFLAQTRNTKDAFLNATIEAKDAEGTVIVTVDEKGVEHKRTEYYDKVKGPIAAYLIQKGLTALFSHITYGELIKLVNGSKPQELSALNAAVAVGAEIVDRYANALSTPMLKINNQNYTLYDAFKLKKCDDPKFLGLTQIWLDNCIPNYTDYLNRGQGVKEQFKHMESDLALAWSCITSKRKDLSDNFEMYVIDLDNDSKIEVNDWYRNDNLSDRDKLEFEESLANLNDKFGYYLAVLVESALNYSSDGQTDRVYLSKVNNVAQTISVNEAINHMQSIDKNDWWKLSQMYPLYKAGYVDKEDFMILSGLKFSKDQETKITLGKSTEEKELKVLEATVDNFILEKEIVQPWLEKNEGAKIPKEFSSFRNQMLPLELNVPGIGTYKVSSIEAYFQFSKKIGVWNKEQFDTYVSMETTAYRAKSLCSNEKFPIRKDWESMVVDTATGLVLKVKEQVMLNAFRQVVANSATAAGVLYRLEGMPCHLTIGQHEDPDWGMVLTSDRTGFAGNNLYGNLLAIARSEVLKKNDKKSKIFVPKAFKGRKTLEDQINNIDISNI